jgi:hypothetical protein
VCERAAHALILALEKETDAGARLTLAHGLDAVARQAPSEATARALVALLEKEKDPQVRGTLAAAVAAAGRRMGRGEATQVYGRAARALALAREKETDASARQSLAHGLAELTGAMEPADAAGVLATALEKEPDTVARRSLAGRLAAVAGRMGPAEAAQFCEQAAQALFAALDKGQATGACASWAEDLDTVVLPGQAARYCERAARRLVEILEKKPDTVDYRDLIRGLAVVTYQMEPARAARIRRQAARVLTTAAKTEKGAGISWDLVGSLADLVEVLSQEEVAKVCDLAVGLLIQTARSNNPLDEPVLGPGEALASLLSRLDDAQANRLAREVTAQVCSRGEEGASLRTWDGEILDAVLTDNSRPRVRRRIEAATMTVGLAGGVPLAALPSLIAANEPLPCRLSTQDLVDLLKMPTCVGKRRQAILKQLGRRYGRDFDNHWEFVRFAHEQHLDLEFTKPPQRPGGAGQPDATE